MTAYGVLIEENVQILVPEEVATIIYRMQTEGSDSEEETVAGELITVNTFGNEIIY